MTTIHNSAITVPAIAELLAPREKRDWNLSDLLSNYPWLYASDLDKTIIDLSDTTITPEQNQNMLAEIEHIQNYYALSVNAMRAQRNHLIANAVFKNAWPEFVALPKPNDFFLVDDDSVANSVLRQHWVTALWEWVESEPEPDDNGVAICNMTPDDYCAVPFFIEMRSMPAPADTDYLVIHLAAYMNTGEFAGTYAGTAIWMRHLPSMTMRLDQR